MINTNFRYESEEHDKLLDYKHFCNKRCGYNIFKDMYIIPTSENGKSGGLYNNEGNLISETSTNKDFDCETVTLDAVDSYDHLASPCIYLGVYEKVWGHFITDSFKKIWFLNSKYYTEYKSYKLLFISDKTQELGASQRRLLELLGIDVSRIKLIRHRTHVDTILVPDSCFYYDEPLSNIPYSTMIHYTAEYVELIDSIRTNCYNSNKKEYEKIYYSYSKYRKKKGFRKTFGEEKLDAFFKDQGFTIIHPEDYSIDEQLNMLSNCKFFAATEGSVSHNSVFLHDNAKVIIIPRGPYFSGYQQAIDTIGKREIFYVDSSLTAFSSITGPWSGPNYFIVSEQLMDFFNVPNTNREKYRKQNFSDIRKYFIYCICRLGGRKYYTQNIYSELFFYHLGQNSNHVFPFSFLINKIKEIFNK